MKRYLPLLILIFIACSDDHHDPKKEAMSKVSELCIASSATLSWFQDLLQKAHPDSVYAGDIYAFRYSGGVAIVHQPYIISCWGCSALDCAGREIQLTASTRKEISDGMVKKNRVYRSLIPD